MKRLFLLFFLVISLSALYLYFASIKEGARSRSVTELIKIKAKETQKEIRLNNRTKNRVAKKE